VWNATGDHGNAWFLGELSLDAEYTGQEFKVHPYYIGFFRYILLLYIFQTELELVGNVGLIFCRLIFNFVSFDALFLWLKKNNCTL